MVMGKSIIVKGARVNNLKNIDVTIPRDKLVVITGVSGSGKSSLAFDTIYAEGQRRYIESLSSYARQFIEQMEKPDVDQITGLSPTIAIDQKSVSKNPRSTVGTVTEIHDYLRLLFANIGHPHCWICGREISVLTTDQIIEEILKQTGKKLMILSPIIRGRKGVYQSLLNQLLKDGFIRVRVDGKFYNLNEDSIELDKYKAHTIEIVIDRLIISEVTPELRKRVADSVETALNYSKDLVNVYLIDENKNILLSRTFGCSYCAVTLEKLTPRMFSFNSPYGACETCDGLGYIMKIDPDLVIPDKNLSISEGAIKPFRSRFNNTYYYNLLQSVAEHYGFSLDTPFNQLDEKHQRIILYGSDEVILFKYTGRNGSYWQTEKQFEGIIPILERRYNETTSLSAKIEIEQYMAELPCPSCNGKRLKPASLAVKVNGKNISELEDMSVSQLYDFFNNLKLTDVELMIADKILREIKKRLEFLINVGLDYLTLSRSSRTLAGGEAQRIRLATQLGSGLMGVIYILDEPSIGLHPRDNLRLINTLKNLRDLGNTVIVVEHDEETMRNADYIIDIGPGAGENGGLVVASGTPSEFIMNSKESLTAKYLRGELKIHVPSARRQPKGFIRVIGARANNLKNITVDFPLGVFCAVTGVSGSGKSTLVEEILYKGLMRRLHQSKIVPGEHEDIKGLEQIDKVIMIDQSPIGRTPRSNLATYTGVWTHIRDIFSQTPDARKRGYKPGRFSFNVKGGRCESCEGQGLKKIEMHFLPDIYIPCEVCDGKRFNVETLQIKYKDKNIYDILNMSVNQAIEFFSNIPPIVRILKTVQDVGLGYVKLGQQAPTLSGGEAQRIKLSRELSKRDTGRTLYILDEPTTGLHFSDIQKLLDVLNRLVDAGNTVIIIEHNLDVIKSADYIIDLGPEGGEKGGLVIAQGTPEQIAENNNSYTGNFLRGVLAR
ncbi:MAG: excinuclease ABC subunit UvrA [Candidatus Odinarchaeum yellowstonii]|uniref:UvrABC system protein A n=1 Tax=Odinarchaeota yellowstonii (strain LCB_4) TaxID=1841599 RepID=A0AAF0D2K0_ODILC|nr:MAG: excinuclease ABC subunit UvrA [Candidatus Odinarchaeum yellowstonii]